MSRRAITTLIAGFLATVFLSVPDRPRAAGDDWRENWEFTLSRPGESRDDGGQGPSTSRQLDRIEIRIVNRGDTVGVLSTLAFTLNDATGFMAIAIDPVLNTRVFEVAPGGHIELELSLWDLKFSNGAGDVLGVDEVRTRLDHERCSIWASFVDQSSPKPSWESNLAVASNTLELGP